MNGNDETRQWVAGGSQKKLAAGEARAIVTQRRGRRHAPQADRWTGARR